MSRRALDRMIRGELEQVLRTELAQLRESLRASALNSRMAEKTASSDLTVHAAEALDTEIQVTLVDRRAQQAAQIQGALQRLSDGQYGLCQECEAFVGVARLRALPFAQRCRDCQNEVEQRTRREGLAPTGERPNELEAA